MLGGGTKRYQNGGDEEIDEARDHAARRNDQPREVNLGNQVGIGHKAVAAFRQGGGKKLPRKHTAEHEQRIGHPAGRHLAEPAKHQGQYDHGEKRADEGPGHTDYRLLVADEKVAPRQEIEQFAVTPQIAPVVTLGAASFED
jgi:hypothetical protein